MKSEKIRERFLKFFEERGHKIVSSAPLVPENDPSVLFTTAGMQQFKPYYIGEKSANNDFGSLNTTSIQKCVRTSDINEVGDERHLTFFEMLGNFSFGGYWKKEAIKYAYEFITSPDWMNLKIDYVTVFGGEANIPPDSESEQIWKSIDPNITIKRFGRADNFWGPTGEKGPCGSTTEIYVHSIEIWNIVFNEFYQNTDKSLQPLKTRGIDTGMGLERLAKVAQKVPTVFETDLFNPILLTVNQMSRPVLDRQKNHVLRQNQMSRTGLDIYDIKIKRIIADHVRTAVFMIADGVTPSNTEQGYVLRRLLRRAIINKADMLIVAGAVMERYKNIYDISYKKELILSVIKEEEEKFKPILNTADKYFKIFPDKQIPGDKMFALFSSKGIPLELAENLGFKVDRDGFEQEMKKHQEISKSGMEQKFKGGLGGHSETEMRYHTATHLLHQALRDVLGGHIEQKGSNITPERLRFDFSHPQKMTDEEKKEVERIVNEKILAKLPVKNVILPKSEAEKIRALHFFGDKYGDNVSVYFIGDSLENAYSKEFCGGPHVERTSDLVSERDPDGNLKGPFKITKEEAISAGVRRIKAILE